MYTELFSRMGIIRLTTPIHTPLIQLRTHTGARSECPTLNNQSQFSPFSLPCCHDYLTAQTTRFNRRQKDLSCMDDNDEVGESALCDIPYLAVTLCLILERNGTTLKGRAGLTLGPTRSTSHNICPSLM